MRRAFFFLVCVMVQGCGANEPPDPLLHASGFCDAWAERLCQDHVTDICGAQSVAKCKAAQVDECLGRVTDRLYTARGARECLDAVGNTVADDALNAKEYDLLTNLSGACEDLLSGDGEDGDACSNNLDCNDVDGLYCVKAEGNPEGKCRDPHFVGGGGKCNAANAVCEEGFYCNGTNCLEKQTVGDACDAETPCADNLLCSEGGDSGTTSCISKLENGEQDKNGNDLRCASNNDCQSNLCSKVEDSETGLCTNLIRLNTNAAICKTLR